METGLKLLTFACVWLLSSTTANAKPSCLAELKASLEADQDVSTFESAYTCGTGERVGASTGAGADICLIGYHAKNFDLRVFAFLDQPRQLSVLWAPDRDGFGGGWEHAGHHLCADVKTYLTYTHVTPNELKIQVTRQTALDQLFCPFSKVYSTYTTTCHTADGLNPR